MKRRKRIPHDRETEDQRKHRQARNARKRLRRLERSGLRRASSNEGRLRPQPEPAVMSTRGEGLAWLEQQRTVGRNGAVYYKGGSKIPKDLRGLMWQSRGSFAHWNHGPGSNGPSLVALSALAQKVNRLTSAKPV